MNDSSSRPRWRSRLILLLLVAVFLGTFIVAATLRFSGWLPQSQRQFGQLLQPPIALSSLELKQADGQRFAWSPASQQWHVLVVAPEHCEAECTRLADQINRLWRSEGRLASRLRILWFGDYPDSAPRYGGLSLMQANADLTALLPQPRTTGAPAIEIVDPEGFLVLHYQADVPVAWLKKDLSRVLK